MADAALIAVIATFDKKADEAERNMYDAFRTVNALRAEAGMPPRKPGGGGGDGDGASTITQIGPDTFYGKRLQTASREYLQMRRSLGLGPATPREIYEAVVSGGYQFDAKDAETAMVGLRAMLRKRSAFFHKLPNGSYGLTAWYEHIRTQRQADIDAVVDELNDDEVDDAGEDQNDVEGESPSGKGSAPSSKKGATAA